MKKLVLFECTFDLVEEDLDTDLKRPNFMSSKETQLEVRPLAVEPRDLGLSAVCLALACHYQLL